MGLHCGLCGGGRIFLGVFSRLCIEVRRENSTVYRGEKVEREREQQGERAFEIFTKKCEDQGSSKGTQWPEQGLLTKCEFSIACLRKPKTLAEIVVNFATPCSPILRKHIPSAIIFLTYSACSPILRKHIPSVNTLLPNPPYTYSTHSLRKHVPSVDVFLLPNPP